MTTSSLLASVYDQLTDFANLSNFWSLFNTAFGSSYDSAKAATFQYQWQNHNFSQFPQIEVVNNGVLGTANAAYAISTNKIYLSDSFISSANQPSLVAVILEEFGHFVDAQVNSVDSAGDEGAIFAALVQGQSLDAATLQVLKAEDDSATITLNGQLITVEQSTDPGNTRATAYNFGALTYNLTPPLGVPVFKQYVDTVGGTDSDDYFKFTLDKTLGIGISASFDANTTLELLDANGVLITSRNGNYFPSIGQNLDAGTYYLHLSTGNTTVSNYTVNLIVGPLDNAGNDIQSAKDLGTLGNTLISQSDYFFQQAAQLGGYPDYVDFDYYQFTLSETRKVTFKTSGSPNSSTSFSLSQRAGNAPYFYESQLGYLYNNSQSGEPSIALDQILGAGTYYILIFGSGVYDSYDSRKPLPVSYVLELSSSAAPSDPGNTKETAYSLGSLNYNLASPSAPPLFVAYSNTIQAASDPDDYYKFTIDKTLGIVLDWSTAGGTDYPNPSSTTKVEILREDGSLVTTQNSPAYSGLGLNLDAGTYYLRFNTNSSVNVNYNFTLGSGPLDNAGNDQAHAKNLGVLGNTLITQSDYVFRSGYKTGGFSLSEFDYYQFSLSQTSQVTFNLTINGSAFGYANLYLYRNSISYGYANVNTPLVKTLDAGTYFINIDGNGAYNSITSSYAPVSYNLSLSTATTTSPTITLAVAPASVLEDGTPNLIYTFTRTGLTTNALTVNYGITGTATNGTDYATIGTNVTFAANSATATVTVNPTADAVIEANETVALTLATGTGYTIGTTTAVTGTITNDDFPSITLAVAPASVLEDGTPNLIYTFTRTGPITNALTVNYGITGTATNGTDYATIGTSVTFAANSATATVTVNPTADTTIENNETVALTLVTGTGYTIGTTTAVTGTITNDDGPTISLGLNYSAISEDSPSNFIYTFTRTGATTNSLTANYSIAGTALSTDYTGATPGTSKTITFAAGSATATLTLDPTADTTLEPNETIILQLVSGTGYTIVTTAAQTATIINDDNTRNQQGTNGNSVLLGKNYSDYLTGGTGNDILNGAGNGDYLTGAAGNDTLTGGSGSDTFFFANANLGIDTITDFTPNEDTIFVSAQGFGSGLIAGNPLTQTQFILGSSATSASQRFIYNSTNGALSFDADGNGLGTAKPIATLSVGLALTSEDIFVN